ncbi:D-tagatose-bisphosphate aldolase, class II, non-catalytic subunit [Paucibacter sp. KBW04]|uniref:D-tagatose-bisphosphate aldolase, class II, non-catalytic subunit n=1 Tax=Paucibacter sp. KBW04 TaxID=2153361 RepID=UPI000F57355F|nr:D-tagatose-bisphosphate aldolase, class II, non-catalytic subunit [Paucibacter sp. KBW04]RQO61167.1 D-tagatose-bisphosphate aldolase, class II, non-catalytic subunit [Paucibacter sp. KBW04]
MSWILQQLAAHRAGQALGIYSVCSANDQVLLAALKHAQRQGSPVLIEATSNQVDQFGGYTGMRPQEFRAHVLALAATVGLAPEQVILGGDHLGPNAWQHLPAAEAMGHARDLIKAYVDAGFEKIHLDCSMRCADDPAVLSDEVIAARSAELCQVAEQAYARGSQTGPAPVYVIGTEVPVPGGEVGEPDVIAVTRVAAAQRTVAVHREAFEARALSKTWPRVVALVVQPGVDFDHSRIFHYQPEAARELAQLAEQGLGGLLFEAHSTDYQTEAALSQLVRDHFAILKVGPALTFALREALFALSAIERVLLPPEQCANLPGVLESCMLASPKHWQKYYTGEPAQQALLRQYSLSDRCRYYWGLPQLRAAQATLLANLDASGIPLPVLSQFMPLQYEAVLRGELPVQAQALLQHQVERVIASYARACGERKP